MRFTKGSTLIPIIIIIASTLLVSSGGYVGVRFYQREKLAKNGDDLFRQGRYKEAAEAYQKSISIWSNKRIQETLAESLEMEQTSQVFDRGISAYDQRNWTACTEELKKVGSTFSRYDEAKIKLEQCQTQLITEEVEVGAPELVASQATTKNQIESSINTSSKQTVNKAPTSQTRSNTDTENNTASAEEPVSTCVSNASPTFTSHLTDPSKINEVVIPPRYIVELKTHSYIGTGNQRVPVYAPVDMKLKGGVFLAHDDAPNDYGMDFQVSCEVTMRIGHITEPIQSIVDTFGPTPKYDSFTNYDIVPINFVTGDLIGYTVRSENSNWDFGVYNSTKLNRYASDPNHSSSWVYKTAVCPFDYFSAELKSSYVSKYQTELGDSVLDGESFCQ